MIKKGLIEPIASNGSGQALLKQARLWRLSRHIPYNLPLLCNVRYNLRRK